MENKTKLLPFGHSISTRKKQCCSRLFLMLSFKITKKPLLNYINHYAIQEGHILHILFKLKTFPSLSVILTEKQLKKLLMVVNSKANFTNNLPVNFGSSAYLLLLYTFSVMFFCSPGGSICSVFFLLSFTPTSSNLALHNSDLPST